MLQLVSLSLSMSTAGADPGFVKGETMGSTGSGVGAPSGVQGQNPPSPSARGSGEHCKLPQRGPGRSSGKSGFWSILGPQKSRLNGQLALNLREGETTMNLEHVTAPAPT